MKLKELLEEFKTAFKKGKEYIEIFKNPSKDDLFQVWKSRKTGGRFLATPDKDLYVFSSNATHNDVIEVLSLPYRRVDFGYGFYSREDNKYLVDELTNNKRLRLPKKKWGWLKKYFGKESFNKI